MNQTSRCLWFLLLIIAGSALSVWAETVTGLLGQAEALIQRQQFGAAEPLLARAAGQDPSNVEVLYRLGYVRYRLRSFTSARQSFLAVVQAAPPAYYSRYFLGRIALAENNPREAVTWLEPVVAARQTVFDAASQLASAYVASADIKKAFAPLRTAIQETPWDGALYYRLGQLHRQTGDMDLAREAFENSRRLKVASREDVETILRISQAAGIGNAIEALQLGEPLLSRANAEPNLLVALGVIYGNAGWQDQALKAFNQAVARDPKLFQAQFNLGLALLKLGRTEEALGALEAAVALLPQSHDATLTLGLARVMSRRYAEAIAPLELARKIDAANPRIATLLATAYMRTGEATKAIPILRAATELLSQDSAPLFLLVEAQNAIGDTNGALETALRAQKLFPDSAQAQMAVAQQYARVGRYQHARPVFEQVLRLEPGHPEAELGLADTMQRAGDHSSAVDHYRQAIPASSTGLAARIGLARSLAALRRLDDAQKVLEETVTSHPADLSARLELSRVYMRQGKSDLASEQSKIVEQLRARPEIRP